MGFRTWKPESDKQEAPSLALRAISYKAFGISGLVDEVARLIAEAGIVFPVLVHFESQTSALRLLESFGNVFPLNQSVGDRAGGDDQNEQAAPLRYSLGLP